MVHPALLSRSLGLKIKSRAVSILTLKTRATPFNPWAIAISRPSSFQNFRMFDPDTLEKSCTTDQKPAANDPCLVETDVLLPRQRQARRLKVWQTAGPSQSPSEPALQPRILQQGSTWPLLSRPAMSKKKRPCPYQKGRVQSQLLSDLAFHISQR